MKDSSEKPQISRSRKFLYMVGGSLTVLFVWLIPFGLAPEGSWVQDVIGFSFLFVVVGWCVWVTRHWEVAPRDMARVDVSATTPAPGPVSPHPAVVSPPSLGMDFTAIDFETATSSRASVCAVGVAVVRGGKVLHREGLLVNPPTGSSFDPRNIAIHGITAKHVRKSPSWDTVQPWLRQIVGDHPAVAHNASFDRSVWEASSSLVGLDPATPKFYCTYELAKRSLSLPRYRLPDVAKELGVKAFKHHDPADDAEAAALIALALAERNRYSTVREFESKNRRAMADAYSNSEAAGEATDDGPLSGSVFCFTGTLRSLSRVEAAALVRSLGGEVAKSMTKRVNVVVAGDWNPAMLKAGATESQTVVKARDRGVPVLDDVEFMEILQSNLRET